MPFGLEGFALSVMGMGIDGFNLVASSISGQPLSEITLPPPSGLVLVLLTAALLMPACLKRRWRLMAIIPLLLRYGDLAFDASADDQFHQTS